jgi:hypothetical protein
MIKPIRLTRNQLIEFSPCDLEEHLAKFGKRKSLTARQALEAGFTVFDLLWVAGRLNLTLQCVAFAINCAEAVASFNPDPRGAAAIQAAKTCMANPTEKHRSAADAADPTLDLSAMFLAVFDPQEESK